MPRGRAHGRAEPESPGAPRVAGTDDARRALDYYAGRGPLALFFERDGQIFRSDFLLR